MAYIIVEPCIDVKDKACVEVCPVDCTVLLPSTSTHRQPRIGQRQFVPGGTAG